mmetsp:Transcript_23540/g.79510  ORF Transcript_23540/g.79510 Transcript_23540/m.79510 type:complete len:85 (+) Transcript_23540:238-492(+)
MDTVTPLKITAASSAANVLLDPLLIFSARLGVAGAGLATSASQLLAAAAYLSLRSATANSTLTCRTCAECPPRGCPCIVCLVAS